jgi:hypothetical protein
VSFTEAQREQQREWGERKASVFPTRVEKDRARELIDKHLTGQKKRDAHAYVNGHRTSGLSVRALIERLETLE